MNNYADGQAIRPFTVPPMCADTAETRPCKGETLIVIQRDGHRLHGELAKADDGTPQLLEGEHQAASAIDPEHVKLINLPTPRTWVDIPHEDNSTIPAVETRVIQYQIEFSDGDDIQGQTLGFNVDMQGLYLFPSESSGQFSYLFVPHGVIASYQLGEKIGKQLIQDQAIQPQVLETALQDQAAIRSRPLGRYLMDKALVTRQELDKALAQQSESQHQRLGDILLAENYITEDQLQEALGLQQRDRNKPLGAILIEMGHINTDDVQKSLATKLGIPLVDLDEIEIDEEALNLLARDYAEQKLVLPLHFHGNKLVVVMTDPLDWKLTEEIRFICNREILPVMSSAESIHRAVQKYFVSIEDMSSEQTPNDGESIEAESEAVSEHRVVRLARRIVADAYRDNVSDIHIECNSGADKALIRFRKDGRLKSYSDLAPGLARSLISRYKVMANMDVANKHTPQDGKINFARFGDLDIDLRLAAIPTVAGLEDLVIRLLASGEPKPIEQLDMSKDNLECAKYVLRNPHGLFLVCGPTGSGKTTTLHSFLAHLNTPDRKIWSVEDPVEISQPGIRQVNVNHKLGIGFAETLKAFLRADPDIIMVGEMRDRETTSIGIQAALTGHLVLSTLHTNSAVESAVRLLEMGMDPYNFSDSLLGILAQRLVRRLCPDCRVAVTASEALLQQLADEYCRDYQTIGLEQSAFGTTAILDRWHERYASQGTITLYERSSDGCKACEHNGYRGRIGIHEMMMASADLRVAIYRQVETRELLKLTLSEGMTTLKQDGIDKVLQGLTDMSQVREAGGSI